MKLLEKLEKQAAEEAFKKANERNYLDPDLDFTEE
jgi:hypothetical protein